MTRYRIVKIWDYYDEGDCKYFYVTQKNGIFFWKSLYVLETEYLAKVKLESVKSSAGKLKEVIYED